jgi:hypothetical protein
MSTPRERAQHLFKADEKQTASDRRDREFFALRKAQEEENRKKTERLRALRLAHEATLPPKAAKPARRGKSVAPSE